MAIGRLAFLSLAMMARTADFTSAGLLLPRGTFGRRRPFTGVP